MRPISFDDVNVRILATVAAFVFLAGCGPGSIDDMCADIATEQCSQCYSCGPDGAALCGVAAGADESACADEIAARCGDQSATVEGPKSQLDTCIESLPELTCDQLVTSYAQGGPVSTPACEYFM